MTVRSVRNNNPMNLRIGQPWLGLCPPEDMTPEQHAETAFCVFKSPDYGFRAGALTLLTYQRRYKLNTVYQIITRFAPSNENDTKAYIKHISDYLGVLSGVPLKLDKLGTLELLCKGIAIHESGGWMFDDKDLSSGVSMALGLTSSEGPENGSIVA